ncbi:BREX-1 system adenine-specific DNA-methyltransferase PglX [Planococcus sp. APC 3906]|uniref:BREX-1 system adenine-specific DNA-methyltransferase PglX n=1 Tax=Planococcus sp. APC 3906 TaxID=3035194 RepID=UPI0025B61B69|nr:BREX-1 system adenine-specific DNA-methyltransferase PglX [Planococcus sp. APC 3906]MDN3451664.1 BREX-1 system adenine-specific DNA-methyltransferase PglX [Planococcus sp. APC 3906]
MNKPALKRFATEARRELLERIVLQARKIGITSEGVQKATIESSDAVFIDGKQLSEKERVQRNKLIYRIREIGFDRVMEEVAYTWFNRFTALRFMEVNDYLPTKVRVLSSLNPDSAEPDMMKEALTLELDLDKEYIYNLKMNNNDEELFKYLIIKHCNDLNRFMPFMFETIDDYTEVLFPAGLLVAESCIQKMTNIEVIPESNWEKIEVVGWLYQYYIAEEKERVFKTKKKYKAEEIPFATQLFTPDWIVRYMVQNSLGRYWVEAHPEHQDLVRDWEFYLEKAEEGFEKKIAPYINKELKVEDIKCFDPAMGSGHILVYMFDVLYEIYSKSGYSEREIPRLIIENNLYGLDIDDRAYQLACFSVVMKALEYNKRFLRSIEREGLILNLASIQESNSFNDEDIEFLAGSVAFLKETQNFLKQFQHAKTIGSLIKISDGDTDRLEKRLEVIDATPISDLFEFEKREKVLYLLPKIIKQAQIMSMAFDILITNPPYMSSSSMNKELANYLKKNYPDSKADLFAAFMEIDHFIKQKGFFASVTQHSWMFLSSYENLRRKIIENRFIESMLHLGSRAFEEIGGEVVQSTTFVMRNLNGLHSSGTYIQLTGEKTSKEKREKALKAIENINVSYRYRFSQDNYINIPGSPIAFWASKKVLNIYKAGLPLETISSPRQGMATSNNSLFLKMWFEVKISAIGFNIQSREEAVSSKLKWFPYNKGGSYRKWYGNNEYVVNWENDGQAIKEFRDYKNSTLDSNMGVAGLPFIFKENITWSKVTTGKLSVRYLPKGHLFDVSGCSIYSTSQTLTKLLALLNSNVIDKLLSAISQTLNYEVGSIKKLPIIDIQDFDEYLVEENIDISKKEWDSFETSWDFSQHPLIKFKGNGITLKESFILWENHSAIQYNKLKKNEEEINRNFIEIYELEEEMTPDIEDKDIVLRKANLERDIKSFISYAIGCSFGRYSLDREGLINAGDEFNSSNYEIFQADEDNIIPILTESYFKDDILELFVDFMKVTFGVENLEENINFVANAIGQKKNETARETLRRYFLNDYYKDHLQVYKKRPIYWLFTSGKEKAFNCLIYMHRYDKTTLSRIRTDYLHEVQIRMDSKKKDLINIIDGDSSTKEVIDSKNELKYLDKKIDELKAYDEKLHHMADMQIEIDLDDGVVVNYAKFEGLVAKI